jgi:hypothetical protein
MPTTAATPTSGPAPTAGPTVAGEIATEADFKVAFIGDSGTGSGFQSVLTMIKNENADMVIHSGDFAYGTTSTWTSQVNATFPNPYPYLGSVGNHDSWSQYAPFFSGRLTAMGITPPSGMNSNPNYAVEYKGLKMAFVKIGGDPAFINQALGGSKNIWKICSWHENMNAMQVGGKPDSQGWPDYETCKQLGAIVATGHEHIYARTKTLTSMQNQTVDSSCSSPTALCVGANRTFAFVSGIGGNGVRNQERCLPTSFPYGCKGEWASVYAIDQAGSKDYGALFITFNTGGDPKKATGYFKSVAGKMVDQFTITKS